MMSFKRVLFASLVALAPFTASHATTDAFEPYIGEMKWVAFDFAPRGWAKCDGQILPINQNQALFSLLGTQYGGDGRTTFALPDLRGRAMIGDGQSSSGTDYDNGDRVGSETVTLTPSQLPAHNHSLEASSGAAENGAPQSGVLANTGRKRLYSDANPNLPMAAATTYSGNGQPHNNMAPSTTLNCIIALQGIFPSRS